MDKIRSSSSRFQSRLTITNGSSKNYDPSKDTIYFEEYDFAPDSGPDDKIPEYQLAEMQRRKKHFDEFKKLYNNKLEEKEARKRAEEEEKHDAFLQHPISKLLSKYGFKIPKNNKQVSMNSLCSRNPHEFSKSGSRSRSGSGSRSSRTKIPFNTENDVGFSDMEIVDIYQRSTECSLTDKPIEMSEDDVSINTNAKEQNIKLRGDIADLEERFNTILQAFQTTSPLRCRFVDTNGYKDNNGIRG